MVSFESFLLVKKKQYPENGKPKSDTGISDDIDGGSKLPGAPRRRVKEGVRREYKEVRSVADSCGRESEKRETPPRNYALISDRGKREVNDKPVQAILSVLEK